MVKTKKPGYSGKKSGTPKKVKHIPVKSVKQRTDSARQIKISHLWGRMKYFKYYYLLLLPALAYFLIFHYIPMYGVILAFKDFRYADGLWGSPWIGFVNFRRLFSSVSFFEILKNTLLISLYRIVFGFPAPLVLALLLNEMRHLRLKKIIQTVTYLPYFISWVILSGILIELLSPARGVVNYIMGLFGGEPIYFLTEARYFRGILISTGIWQSVGWGSIIYLAAIAGIDAEQYDAAYIDGANRYHFVFYITLPSLSPIMVILFILGLAGVLNAGFDQIFNLYNPLVYKVADIIDTYVYRVGLLGMQYSYSTAVGLFKNLVGLVLVLSSNFIIKRLGRGEYGLW